ncbi:predicted protein [Nematostella vectensis]|uniref:HAT C-terminal dimerisation domain-containing protein n=1 Tax=Nematostella vectensis TaxID=45351 RepID=A7SV10_NEMVE|nr:predicted protein [Nematostella vectensis]|eukprot:XP_001624564.1 predicted protein [Nematostella vectensis]
MARENVANRKFLSLINFLEDVGVPDVKYFEHRSQGSIREVFLTIGETIQKTVIEGIKRSGVFGVLVDDVTDAAALEQMITFVQFVDTEENRAAVAFLGTKNVLESHESANTEALLDNFTELMSRRLNTGESDKIWPPYGLVLFISTKEVGVVQSSQAVEEMRVGEYTNVNWSRKTYRTKVLAVADDKLSLMRQEDGYIKLIEDGMLPSPEDLHQIQQPFESLYSTITAFSLNTTFTVEICIFIQRTKGVLYNVRQVGYTLTPSTGSWLLRMYFSCSTNSLGPVLFLMLSRLFPVGREIPTLAQKSSTALRFSLETESLLVLRSGVAFAPPTGMARARCCKLIFNLRFDTPSFFATEPPRPVLDTFVPQIIDNPTLMATLASLVRCCLSVEIASLASCNTAFAVSMTLSAFESCPVATGLLKKMAYPKFLGIIIILKNVLSHLANLSKELQISTLNFAQVQPAIDRAKDELQKIIQSNIVCKELKADLHPQHGQFKHTGILLKGDVEVQVAGLARKYTDTLCQNIDRRFAGSLPVMSALSFFDPEALPTPQSSLFSSYGSDKRIIELKTFYGHVYPLLVHIAKVALVLPLSNAWPERGASKVKLIKNRLRTRLGGEMLNALLCMSINGPPVNSPESHSMLTSAVETWFLQKKRHRSKKLAEDRKNEQRVQRAIVKLRQLYAPPHPEEEAPLTHPDEGARMDEDQESQVADEEAEINYLRVLEREDASSVAKAIMAETPPDSESDSDSDDYESMYY